MSTEMTPSQPYEQGRADERAAAVAHLRSEQEFWQRLAALGGYPTAAVTAAVWADAANDIENGDHVDDPDES